MTVFGHDYADCYDLLYGDKDYATECDLVEAVFRKYGDGSIVSVLDLGCGTGNHALPLSRRGYDVTGVDRSEGMLFQARQKQALAGDNGTLTFRHGDIRSVDLARQYDAVLMMFAVLGYQGENDDVLAALKTARRHARPGGLFVFDVWYGPAVLHERPSQRVRVIPTREGKVVRFASGAIDAVHHTCSVSYRIWRIVEAQLVAEAEETHVMRYYFPLELDLFLSCSGFKLLRLGAFSEVDRQPDETTWNCLGVAQAI